MNKRRMIKVITFDIMKKKPRFGFWGDKRLKVLILSHQKSILTNLNIVSAMGDLCSGRCKWCHDIKNRIMSRTGMRLE